MNSQVLQYLELLNSTSSSNEQRQEAQTTLLSIQKDPSNWQFIPTWLTHPQLSVQFFGAQCLLVRINRDWDSLEESEQVQLRDLIGQLLGQSSLAPAARNKLDEALVRVMEKGFISKWWRDPIGDLLSKGPPDYKLLALIPSMAESAIEANSSKSVYPWHHEIKSHSNPVIEAILTHHSGNPQLFDCIRNWTNFGAFTFSQVERILPLLVAKITETEEDFDVLVDCLVEVCELPSRDPSEEARKARHILPICLKIASLDDPVTVTKLSATLAEECASFLVHSIHDQQVQQFLTLMLKLVDYEGVVGVDNTTSQMTLNAWYLVTEAIDAETPPGNAAILSSLLGGSLVPILLEKATMPSPQIWGHLQRDLQQQFLQIRREFLDTLLYIQRALKVLNLPNLLLEMILADFQQTTKSKSSFIEVRLRALMIVAEEEEESSSSGGWSVIWQNLASLIFSTPEITRDSVNAKLGISLIGSLLPLMKSSPAADEAVRMLLNQLESNQAVRLECLDALQQALDAEVPLLYDPQIVNSLVRLLASSSFELPPETRSKFIKLLSQLISDLPGDGTHKWQSFNSLIQVCSQNYTDLIQVLKTPFHFESDCLSSGPSVYRDTLDTLKRSEPSLEAGEALLAAWLSLSGRFAQFESAPDHPEILLFSYYFKASNDQQFFVLASKLLAAWVYGMSRVNPSVCLKLLESVTHDQILMSPTEPHEDGIEALLDAWNHLIKIGGSIPVDSQIYRLHHWILERISVGHLSVPLLRSFARFFCVLIESSVLNDPTNHLAPILVVIFRVGISGIIGRSGVEILARVAHDISLQHPDTFRHVLSQLFGGETSEISVNYSERRAFLRNLGSAHTIKKFKSVLVEFCLQSRGIL